jgi:regulator of ribonuclease activity A
VDRAEAVTTPTADLCDAHPGAVQVLAGGFHDYGGRASFGGPAATLRVHEDWRPVLAALDEPGAGRVLVVDAGGSARRAVLGERLLTRAAERGWAGVIINGAVRDTAATRRIAAGLRALATVPMRGESGDAGERGGTLTFAGATVGPGDEVWADADGIIVLGRRAHEA